jgi:hypothetical protein
MPSAFDDFAADLVSELHPALTRAERALVAEAVAAEAGEFIPRFIDSCLGEERSAMFRHLVATRGFDVGDAYLRSVGIDFPDLFVRGLAAFRTEKATPAPPVRLMPDTTIGVSTVPSDSTDAPAVRAVPAHGPDVTVKSSVGRRPKR